MKNEPDIIKELREAEKKNLLKKTNHESEKTCYENFKLSEIEEDLTKNNETHKELKKSEEKYLNLTNFGPDAIITLDTKGYITYCNKATEKLIGLDKKKLICKNISEIESFFEEDVKKYFIAFESLKQGKERDIFDFKIKKNNRPPIWGEVHIGLLKEGNTIIGSQILIRDNTKNRMLLNELKDAHEVLFTINKDLERRIKDRTSEIRNLIEQKDEFINQLSHDLKTPLTPIIILLPLIKEYIKEPKAFELIEVINRNIYFMKDLVDKTINLAKLNSTKIKFELEDTNLFSEVNKVIENSRILIEKNDINIENLISKDINVKTDTLRLDELFNNLITNSVKYCSDGGGNITINADKNKDEVTISVKDNGIGMDKNQVKDIFDEFYKIDQSRHELDSSGLGLAICKRIVEKHGGKIWANSKGIGKGTTFYFTLKTSNN